MQDGNIGQAGNISQDSFDIDLSVLKEAPVGGQESQGSIDSSQSRIEIDERYKGLPEAEAIARTIQSKYDRLNVDYLNEVKRAQENAAYKDILGDIYQNEDALMALINEVKPDLVAQRDINAEIKKRIVTEFGEGYVPTMSRDEAERKDPGGKDFRYYKRVDALWNELSQTGSGYAKYKTLKEFREARAAELQAQEAAVEAEIQEAINRFKMTQAEVEWNRKWASSLKFADIVEISRFIRKFKNTPAMGNIPGGETGTISKERAEFLKTLK